MTEISQENRKDIAPQLDEVLQNGIPEWQIDAADAAFLEQMARQGHQIVEAFVRFGNHYYELWEQKKAPSITARQQAFFATYFWPEGAKGFLILWRDVLFELQKAFILHQVRAIPKEEVIELYEASQDTVRQAASELSGLLDKRLQDARKQKGGVEKILRELKLQQNPWPVYRDQLQEILSQLDQLVDSFRELSETAEAFQVIREALFETVAACQEELVQHRKIAQQAIDSILHNGEVKPGKIANQLEEKEADIQLANHLSEFSAIAEKKLASLQEKIQVPVDTEGGLILYKEINFQRSTRQWMDSEVLPLLYEIWEITELNTNGLKMSLLNIRNRALLLASDGAESKNIEFDRKDLVYPMQSFIRKSDATEQDMLRLKEMVQARMKDSFSLSRIYHHSDSFLPVPLQSTINKLRVNQNALVSRLQEWTVNQSKAFSRFRKTVEIEESLSVSEKVVRYLQSRNWETTNTHYNSLFLTKGYIGESFWVGRQDELNHLERLIQDWRNGYRGAVALTGQRLSGKSLMGELVSNRYFPQRTIRLAPQSSITVQGRRMSTTYDLEEALSFIRKHTLNTPYLIWIDDLELWRDHNISLGKNVSALRRYIDDYGNHLFFLVAMGNSLRHQLERFFDIMKVFQAEINLDRMPLQDVRDAIMIRHGATHKELLDSKEREVHPQQFQQMTAKVHKAANGNIGEALNIWAFSTHAIDEDRVMHHLKNLYELPDVISQESALLLSSVVLAKKTNEYRLRKLFGPAFSDKYRGVLQRLISIGLLRRAADGWLEITESAANDLGRILEKKNYLKFHR
ncbi:ATP-binding protein [Flavilitoribacter nigricans]|uniref:Uncharacterized protein n=1 Tax=Flavilitoribacter nigricans (strain ATCC 23147 / DSM 23189 / NBRC 102662 / NCIMB 1420 / SS-2) TaxID=1122177 RepID=A0A2D0NBK3_FLAN2|nr:hypothetical protein [Flavilitoribacter nigricans]PHN05891.1 hypothetical protein CRP01_12985 [Flavilitoribacter nigricans DSM 23189 = NBRC 102662]